MKIKVFNLALFSIVVLSIILMLLGDNNVNLGIFMSVSVFILNLAWIKNNDIMFYNFIICTLSWGATFNLKYILGSIMLSDITLVILIISMLLTKFKNKLKFRALTHKEVIFTLFFLIFEFMIGTVSGYKFHNVFQDFKLIIYLLIPYIYLINKPYKFNKKFYINLLKVLCICAMIVCFQEIVHFIKIGPLNMIHGGFGNRDVTIQVQIVTIMAVIMIFINKKVKIFSNVGLILFEVICGIGCLLSFTRTIWITYIISMLICIVLNDKMGSFLKKLLIMSISIIIVVFIISSTDNNFINETVNAFIKRFSTISLDITGNQDTLSSRFNDSYVLLKNKILTFSFLWGKGLGDTFSNYAKNIYYTFNENSILYYTWKYGTIFTSVVIIYLIKVIIKTLSSKNIMVIASSLAICIYIIIGNFSGNLNGYYLAPVLSIYLAYPKCTKDFL